MSIISFINFPENSGEAVSKIICRLAVTTVRGYQNQGFALMESNRIIRLFTYLLRNRLDDHLSDFLMRSICDVLCCGEYDTAARVLEKMGWLVDEVYQEDFPTLDMDALLKQRSEYGADAVCGCAYDEEKQLLLAAKIDKADSRNSRIMIYRKE